MHKYLHHLLICPNCKHDLKWDISCEDNVHIIDAKIICPACNKNYFISDRIACFLVDFNDTEDNWQRGDDCLTKYFIDNPCVKDELLNSLIDSLNAADLNARAIVVKRQGNIEEAAMLNKLGYEKAYTQQTQKAIQSQLDFVSQQFAGKNGFIVDIASGTGRLVDILFSRTPMDIIATDISYSVLKKSQSNLKTLEEINRMSYITFDANAIPFKDNSIEYMTTFIGLQNIGNPNQIFNELKRVSDGTFYAICDFCPENDLTNRTALENYGIDKLWIKNRLIGEFEKVDWKTDCKNSIVAEVKPTPAGEIVKGYGIDGFPIADSHFEYCTMILYK